MMKALPCAFILRPPFPYKRLCPACTLRPCMEKAPMAFRHWGFCHITWPAARPVPFIAGCRAVHFPRLQAAGLRRCPAHAPRPRPVRRAPRPLPGRARAHWAQAAPSARPRAQVFPWQGMHPPAAECRPASASGTRRRSAFPFHQGTGHRVQLLHMLGKNAARRLIGFIQHITNLAVDFSRHLLGIPAARAEIAPKESFVRV